MYKVGSERKRRGLAGLRGGTCRLTPKALPTLIQVHYAVRCPGPCKERDPAETLPRCAQRKPTSSIITRSTCLGHKGGFFLKSQQEKPYILSYLELPYCFIFSVFILKSMSSSTAGWIQSLDMQIMYYFMTYSIHKPFTLPSYLFPDQGSTLQNDHRKCGSFHP